MNWINKQEIIDYCISTFNFPLKDGQFDFDFFTGKEIRILKSKSLSCLGNKEKNTGKVHTVLLFEDEEYPLRDCELEIVSPISQKSIFAPIQKLVKDKYFLTQGEFKSVYYKTKEYQEKINSTCLKKYGKNSVDIFRDKGAETMKKKYGVSSFLERGPHYEAVEKSMVEKYGCKIPIQNKTIKDKITKTIKEKYGVSWFLSRGVHYDKITDILLKKYGEENPFFFIKNLRNCSVSKLEIEVLDTLFEMYPKLKKGKYFCHSTTQFRHRNPNYLLDYYSEQENIVIEIYGDYWHCNPEVYESDYYHIWSKMTAGEIWEKDKLRKRRIINTLNCTFIEIWEKDWKTKKELVLKQIEYAIENKKN